MWQPKNKYTLKPTITQLGLIAAIAPKDAAAPPVDFATFVGSHDYLGRADSVWPAIVEEQNQVHISGCKGMIAEVGIGGGKSFRSALELTYQVYLLGHEHLVMGRDPRRRLNLDQSTLISVATVSVEASLAKRIVFGHCMDFVTKSPWFKQWMPPNPKVTSSLQFYCGGAHPLYEIFPGHSLATSVISLDLWAACIDEANFFKTPEGNPVDYAEEMWEAIEARIHSRMGKDNGFLAVISSRRTVRDFTAKRIAEEERSGSGKIYCIKSQPTWHYWPVDPMTADDQSRKVKSRNQWKVFNHQTLRWYDGTEYSWVEADRMEPPPSCLWVPDEYWEDAERNPEKFLRDHASFPSESLEPYFRNKDALTWARHVNPVMPNTKPEDWLDKPFEKLLDANFKGQPGMEYCFHIDMALNRKGRGDVAGMSMAHTEGLVDRPGKRGERAKKYRVDMLGVIGAPPSGEIQFKRVREFIKWLRDSRGFNIVKATRDGWQSIESNQLLHDEGFNSAVQSMDKTLEPYETLKEAANEGRVEFPAPWEPDECRDALGLMKWKERGDPAALALWELAHLELVNNKKVDHPRGESKDVADAIAGSIYGISLAPVDRVPATTPFSLHTPGGFVHPRQRATMDGVPWILQDPRTRAKQ